jgi:ATP-dependent RNA helicase RhlE
MAVSRPSRGIVRKEQVHLNPTTFAELGVSDRVSAVLASTGITTPFPVQELVLPVASSGRDVLVRSPTGSGKTLAFGLPVIEGLTRGRRGPAALVLAPTRELAAQIADDLAPLAAARNLRVAVCYGGVGLDAQAKRSASSDLLVATPGRLTDLCQRGMVSLAGVEVLIVDEADRMLDMGFKPQVEAIIRRLPTERQTMFFSATLDGAVGRLAEEFSTDAARLEVSHEPELESLGYRLRQSFVACTSATKHDALVKLIEGEDDLVLVFCRTKHGADRLARTLAKRHEVAAAAMHGNLTQGARERALAQFSHGRPRVLVATDVASRGIDLDDIGLVINFDPPDDRDSYTHRIGRTARAGRTGRAATLVLPDQAALVGAIARDLGQEAGWAETGYAAPAPRVVYGSRRRGSAFGPTRSRPAPSGPSSAPRANRVKRGAARPTRHTPA